MDIDIRRATSRDQDAIVALVRSDRLNPTGLDWQHFIVAADDAGRLVGAVQLRRHNDGARELGSLIVTPALRGRGVAARMIDALLAGQRGAVHMITSDVHAEHYALWGFKAIEARQAPRSVRRGHLLGRLARVLTWLRRLPPRRLVILERNARVTTGGPPLRSMSCGPCPCRAGVPHICAFLDNEIPMHRTTSRSRARRRFAGFALLASLSLGLLPGAAAADPRSTPRFVAAHATEAARRHDTRCPGDADAFVRTELFFGLSRPGGVITEEEFKVFVDMRVTPRFPDGLTVLTGSGQFRSAKGTTVVEGSKLLILLVPRRDGEADRKIEAIRRDYQHQFQQESVLRADAVSCVAF